MNQQQLLMHNKILSVIHVIYCTSTNHDVNILRHSQEQVHSHLILAFLLHKSVFKENHGQCSECKQETMSSITEHQRKQKWK